MGLFSGQWLLLCLRWSMFMCKYVFHCLLFKPQLGGNPAGLSFTMNLSLHRHWDAREEKWRRPAGWKHNSFILQSGVFSFTLSGGWLSHAGLPLVDDMHYNFHSWEIHCGPMHKDREKSSERERNTLTWVCFVRYMWLFSSVDFSNSPENNKFSCN